MMGYYEKQDKLVDMFCGGELTETEFYDRLLGALKEGLSDDEEGHWLAWNYYSTAEYLAENDELVSSFQILVDVARREIEIFKETGHDGAAEGLEEMLAKAVARTT